MNQQPNQQKQYGIKETLDVINSLKKLKAAIDVSKEDDGKVTIKDYFNYFGFGMSLPAAISGANKVPLELTDLDSAESQHLKDELQPLLADPKWRRVIFTFVDFGDAVVDLVAKK